MSAKLSSALFATCSAPRSSVGGPPRFECPQSTRPRPGRPDLGEVSSEPPLRGTAGLGARAPPGPLSVDNRLGACDGRATNEPARPPHTERDASTEPEPRAMKLATKTITTTRLICTWLRTRHGGRRRVWRLAAAPLDPPADERHHRPGFQARMVANRATFAQKSRECSRSGRPSRVRRMRAGAPCRSTARGAAPRVVGRKSLRRPPREGALERTTAEEDARQADRQREHMKGRHDGRDHARAILSGVTGPR